ncbi:hypothetical protein ERJ75_000091100 [Trypanosoma vivax]|nr:hypothetical protein ERJ75_000091100 [Trypanosoma vivax]
MIRAFVPPAVGGPFPLPAPSSASRRARAGGSSSAHLALARPPSRAFAFPDWGSSLCPVARHGRTPPWPCSTRFGARPSRACASDLAVRAACRMVAGPHGCRGCVRRRVVPAQLCGAPFVYAALLPSARLGLGPSRVRRRVVAELGLVPRAGACVEGGGCGFGVKRTPPTTACERLVARCVRLCCRTRRRCEKPASLAQRRLETDVSVRCDRASVFAAHGCGCAVDCRQ